MLFSFRVFQSDKAAEIDSASDVTHSSTSGARSEGYAAMKLLLTASESLAD